MSQAAFDGENEVPIALMIQDAGISVEELWLYYFSLSGSLDQIDLDAYLHGLMPLPGVDRTMLALAVDEMRTDISAGTWFFRRRE
ncbi:hypothetical protein ACX80L_16680 [Arthrobacter sp. MDT1-48-3]